MKLYVYARTSCRYRLKFPEDLIWKHKQKEFMKLHEIKQLTDDEISKQIAEEQNNLLDLRFTHSLKQLTNTAKINSTKKLVSRLSTILTERENAKLAVK